MAKTEEYVADRTDHQYPNTYEEQPTPVDEIPPEYRKRVALPGSQKSQIVDSRLCYNWEPGTDGGRLVECSSVAADADAGK